MSTPPTGAYQLARCARRPGRAARPSGSAIAEHAGGEDAEQADEDEVVRGVGERALVAAASMCSAMSQYMPSSATIRASRPRRERQGGPAGQAGDALGERRRRGRGTCDLAGAVADAEPEQDAR